MEIENVDGELPAKHLETSHLRPCAIGDEQRVGTNIERRCSAKLAAPQTDGAHVSKIFIEHMRDHAQHVREIAFPTFVLEVGDHDLRKISTHDTDCLAPISRSNPG
jgi:hypothetical protein